MGREAASSGVATLPDRYGGHSGVIVLRSRVGVVESGGREASWPVCRRGSPGARHSSPSGWQCSCWPGPPPQRSPPRRRPIAERIAVARDQPSRAVHGTGESAHPAVGRADRPRHAPPGARRPAHRPAIGGPRAGRSAPRPSATSHGWPRPARWHPSASASSTRGPSSPSSPSTAHRRRCASWIGSSTPWPWRRGRAAGSAARSWTPRHPFPTTHPWPPRSWPAGSRPRIRRRAAWAAR